VMEEVEWNVDSVRVTAAVSQEAEKKHLEDEINSVTGSEARVRTSSHGDSPELAVTPAPLLLGPLRSLTRRKKLLKPSHRHALLLTPPLKVPRPLAPPTTTFQSSSLSIKDNVCPTLPS
jgi:hypothetical protein